jgi:nucleotide-binding universal stress UspA family protein
VAVGEPVDELLPTAPGGAPWRSLEEQRRASCAAMVSTAVRSPALNGVDVRTAVLPGFPGDRLERLSGEVDLLVVGSRAHGPALRTLIGSTAARLLHTAHCPLLIVPRGAAGPASAVDAAAA